MFMILAVLCKLPKPSEKEQAAVSNLIQKVLSNKQKHAFMPSYNQSFFHFKSKNESNLAPKKGSEDNYDGVMDKEGNLNPDVSVLYDSMMGIDQKKFLKKINDAKQFELRSG